MAFLKKQRVSEYTKCQNQGCTNHSQVLVDENKLYCNTHFKSKYSEEIKAATLIKLDAMKKVASILKKKPI